MCAVRVFLGRQPGQCNAGHTGRRHADITARRQTAEGQSFREFFVNIRFFSCRPFPLIVRDFELRKQAELPLRIAAFPTQRCACLREHDFAGRKRLDHADEMQ